MVGLVAGVTLGFTSFRGSQRQIDSFDRVPIPGTMSVQLNEPSGRVIYYEGDGPIGFDDLTITVTAPSGTPVMVNRYEGELIYETVDLTPGRALATFDGTRSGVYRVDVSGVGTGQPVVGESFSRSALRDILAGLALAAVSVIAGFVVCLMTFIQRSRRSPT